MTASCPTTGKTPTKRQPTVQYNPQVHEYEWRSMTDQGYAPDRGTAWYMAMYDSVERIARILLAGMTPTQHEAAVIHCLNDLGSFCRNLPEHVEVNYLRNRIGWRLRDIRRRAVRENHIVVMPIMDRMRFSVEGDDTWAGLETAAPVLPVLTIQIDDSMMCLLEGIADTQLRKIAAMLAAGHRRQDIARIMKVAPSTITRRVQDLRQILHDYYTGLGIDVMAHRTMA